MTGASPSRAALRAALAARDVAAAKLRTATTAAERAKQMLTEAEAELRAFAAVDAEIAAHRAARIREWAAAGGDRPDTDAPLVLRDLAKRRESKAAAEDHVATVRATYDTLAAELAAAQREDEAAKAAIHAAALQVVREDAERLAGKLEATEQAAARMREELFGLLSAHVHPPGSAPQPLVNSYQLRALLQNRPQNAVPVDEIPVRRMAAARATEAWTSYFGALLQNPEATLETVAA